MNYHSFDPSNGVYVGSFEADTDPLDGGFLLPAHATFITPPEFEQGFVRCFSDDEWVQVPYTTLFPEPEPEPEPEPIPLLERPMDRLTFWLVAASAGVSKWTIRDRISGMPEVTAEERLAKFEAIAWFEEAYQYRRNDSILVALSQAEGITSEQLDALWIYGVAPGA